MAGVGVKVARELGADVVKGSVEGARGFVRDGVVGDTVIEAGFVVKGLEVTCVSGVGDE